MNLIKSTRIATWNVLSLRRTGTADLLSHELTKYGISLAGLCETRWAGAGECVVGSYSMVWSGEDGNSGRCGVALAISRSARRSLIDWNPINSRLLSARFQHRHGKLFVVVGYAPTEVADADAKDEFYDALHDTLAQASPHDLVMVLTDANATVGADCRTSHGAVTGNVFVDGRTNDNGDRMLSLCQSTNLCVADTWFSRKRIHQWTWISNDGHTRKAIDHILVSKRWKSAIHNCRVYRGAQLGNTDHRLLIADVKLKLKTTPDPQTRLRYDSKLLKDPNIAQRFACSISNRFNAIAYGESNGWESFKSGILSATTEALPPTRQVPKKPWISMQTMEIIDKRRQARLAGQTNEYRRLNRIRNDAIKVDRDRYWHEQANFLEEAARRRDQGTLYRELRKARDAPMKKISNVRDVNGNIITTESECLDRWAEHFRDLLNRSPVTPPEDLVNQANETHEREDCSVGPISETEVRLAVNLLKNGRAPGSCAITSEVLKNGGSSMITWLTNIFNEVWSTEDIPADWKTGIILPLWKRKGDQKVCSNYRGITLLSVPGKVFTRILLQRALPALRARRRPEQAGFMPNRSTSDHISTMRILIEKSREFRRNKQLVAAFVDLKAAFDSVDRNCLWLILKSSGVPVKLIRLFQQLYDGAESCVRVNGKLSAFFPTNCGVRQGCVAAPELFNTMVDYLMTTVTPEIEGLALANHQLKDLEYADDTTFLSDSLESILQALSVFQHHAKKFGLEVSWPKTKIMRVADDEAPQSINLNSHNIAIVDQFVYLGSLITNTGDMAPEVSRRRGLASSALKSLWKPLWRHHNISLSTKMRVYNSVVRSVLLYGSETWPLNKKQSKRLSGFDSRALRTVCDIRWPNRISNSDLRQRTRSPPLERILAQNRLRWYGHLMRSDPALPTRIAWDFDPLAARWRRPRGAPRQRYRDALVDDLHHLHLTQTDAAEKALDRASWRRVVSSVVSTPARHEN